MPLTLAILLIQTVFEKKPSRAAGIIYRLVLKKNIKKYNSEAKTSLRLKT